MALYIGTAKIGNVNIGVSASEANLQTKEVTPTATGFSVTADPEYDGLSTVTINGDTDLVAGNIKQGINIFGVTGTLDVGTFVTQEKTVSPTETQQEITPDSGKDGLSKVTVNAISNTYVGSAVTKQAAQTITPTKSEQTVVAANTYTTGMVKVGAIPNNYITTSDADAVEGNILLNKTAYVNGTKLTGSMPNNGAISETITTKDGSVTIPAGYTSGGSVSANVPATTLTNTIINGASFQESTKDYGWRSTVTIPEGYHNAVTLIKEFSSMLPEPETEGAEAQVLVGYDLYDHDGKLINGSMTNNGAVSITLDQTTTSYTVPEGYHNGSGTVSHSTVDIPNPTISINSSGLITASGSWTRGYTTDNSYSNTKQLTTKAAATITPTKSEQTAVNSGVYTTGVVKVAAIPSNYITTTDADAEATDIVENKTAYVNGTKVTGSLKINKYYTGTSTPSSSTGEDGDIYLVTN